MNNSFRLGLDEMALLQRRLGRPPERKHVPLLVNKLARTVGLQKDPRERYFRLLATSALLGLEPMFNSYKPRKKKKK
jgi:hypothetical protein